MKRALALVGAWGLTAPARADAPRVAPTEVELDRGETPPGRTELGFDGGAPVGGWGVTLGFGWMERPITFELADGSETEPVRRRQTVTLGGAIALGESVVVDGRLAGSHQVGDRLRGTGSNVRLDRWVPGDLRLGARIRVSGTEQRAVFVRGDLTLPSGDEGEFAGEPSWSLAWRLIGRATLPGDIVAAASVGLRLRGEEVFVGDRLVGNEFLGSAGIVVPLPPVRPLWCRDQVALTAELGGALGDDVGAARGPSPVEARFGIVSRPRPSVTIGVRAGAGLSDEIGAPELRATLELTYRGAWQLIPRSGGSGARDTID